jgi:hypothetical protein
MTTAHHFIPQANKTYATRENAIKAVQRVFGPDTGHFGAADVRYVLIQHDDGRWFPVFFGQSALEHGIHHRFNVMA